MPISTPEQHAMTEALLQALHDVLPKKDFIALHEPEFVGHEWQYVKECLDTGWVSSVGKFVDRFETELARFTGASHAIVTVNGTAALHMALMLAGVGRDDEVLLPALSFVATANAVVHAGGIPHFVDSETRTLGMDPVALRNHLNDIAEQRQGNTFNRQTGRRIAALVPMHVFGHPVDLDGLLRVAQDFDIPLVEDAAESLGSYYRGQHTGTFGLCGALSFNGNKIITTGGGGAILTHDAALAKRAKHVTTTAKLPHRWAFEHDEVGYNYRLPNLNAALGCAQLESLPRFLASKRHLHTRYQQAFAHIAGVSLLTEPQGASSNYWLQALVLDEAHADALEALLTATNDAGLMTRPLWNLLAHQKPFARCPSAPLPVAESLVRRVINLPSSASLA